MRPTPTSRDFRRSLPDVQALEEVVVRSAFAQTASSSDGTEVGVFLAEPGASFGTSRHGAFDSEHRRRAFFDEPAGASRSRTGAAGGPISLVHARSFGDRRTAHQVG